MTIEIEKNIPLPKLGEGGHEYPFAAMDVGDSFFVPHLKWHDFSSVVYLAGMNLGFGLVAHSVLGGCRCWRVN